MLLTIDVETIPSQHPEALAAVRATLRPPGTLKKAESIAAWWATEAEQAAQDIYRKQALDGGTLGEIISIAVVSDSGDKWAKCRRPGESESELLAMFVAIVEDWTAQDAARAVPNHPDAWPVDNHFLVAHNAPFDIGYLWRRFIINRQPVPPWLPGPLARPGKDFGDTMTLWAGYGGRVSLDSLCRALNVPSPKVGSMDGARVFDAWQAGEVEAIERYNLADAVATAECWHRINGKGWF